MSKPALAAVNVRKLAEMYPALHRLLRRGVAHRAGQSADDSSQPVVPAASEYPLPQTRWWHLWRRHGRCWRPRDVRLACGKAYADPERTVWMCTLRAGHPGRCAPVRRAGRLRPDGWAAGAEDDGVGFQAGQAATDKQGRHQKRARTGEQVDRSGASHSSEESHDA